MASRSALLLLLLLLAGPGARGARGSRGADKQNSLRRAASGVYQGASGLLGEENVRALQKVSGARRVPANGRGREGEGSGEEEGLGALVPAGGGLQKGVPDFGVGAQEGDWSAPGWPSWVPAVKVTW